MNQQKAGQPRKKKWDRPCFCLLLREFTLLAAGYCIESGKWTYVGCWEWKISWKKTLKFIALYNSCRLIQWRRDKGVILNKFSIFVWRFFSLYHPQYLCLRGQRQMKRTILLKIWNYLWIYRYRYCQEVNVYEQSSPRERSARYGGREEMEDVSLPSRFWLCHR